LTKICLKFNLDKHPDLIVSKFVSLMEKINICAVKDEKTNKHKTQILFGP